MERLTMTSNKGGVAFTFDLEFKCKPSEAQKILKLAQKLKEYEDAEEQGLLLRLPCELGDTVYILAGRFGAFYEEDICDGFYIGRDGILQVKVQNHKGNHGTYGVVGKTIFLTQEEAEQALARLREEKWLNQ